MEIVHKVNDFTCDNYIAKITLVLSLKFKNHAYLQTKMLS